MAFRVPNDSTAGLLILILLLFYTPVSCANLSEARRDTAEGFKRIGAEYFNQGDYTAALKNFLEAEKTYSADAELHNFLGLTYKEKKRDDLAIRHFQKAIELAPGYSTAKNNLGTVYIGLEKWDRAIPYLKEAADDLTYETPHFPLSNIAWAYYNQGDYGLAEQYYRKALEYRPKFILALRGLALTHLATGRYSEAAGHLERAIRIAPQIPHLYYDLGEAYFLSGQNEEARRSYKKVTELVPGTPLAAEAEKRLGRIMKK